MSLSRKFFRQNYLNFDICTEICHGFRYCSCLVDQLNIFLDHFSLHYKASNNFKLIKEENQISYTSASSDYLSKNGFHSSLKCVNIMKIIELTTIMKPSQSATKRVMSNVSQTVANRYESKLQYQVYDALVDGAEKEVFIQLNANIFVYHHDSI